MKFFINIDDDRFSGFVEKIIEEETTFYETNVQLFIKYMKMKTDSQKGTPVFLFVCKAFSFIEILIHHLNETQFSKTLRISVYVRLILFDFRKGVL